MGICQPIGHFLEDLLDFIYPRLCYVCEDILPRGMIGKCPLCQHQLQITDLHTTADNEVRRRFTGRLDLVFGSSMYRFYKGGPIQTMVHRWKYKGHPEIGQYLGEEYGKILREVALLSDLDGIIPVPLHPKRLQWRGYNQAETFAIGLGSEMSVNICKNWIIREKRSTSQTGKGREDRLLELMNSFVWRKGSSRPEPGGHFLLVDDILTTGATLEALARPFLEIPSVRLSLVTVALGQK